MEPQEKFFPTGKATSLFDRKAAGKFQSDLYNLAFDKDVAKKRNLLYLVLLVVCILSTVFVVTTASYRTYVVRVDNATGQIEAGGELKATNYEPREAEIKSFLVGFVRDTRTIPLDPVQYKKNWEHAQHFMRQAAAQKMNAVVGEDNPAAKLGRKPVQPEINSIQLQPGTNSTYQVRWVENEFSIGGMSSGTKSSYVALLQIALEPPKKESELLINPLGLKIRDFTLTKESETRDEPKQPAVSMPTDAPVVQPGGVNP